MLEEKILEAIEVYTKRQSRECHPSGKFDSAGRWYPDKEEKCWCCDEIRIPTRAYPYSLLVHCRTIKHIAELYDVSTVDLRKACKNL